MRHKSYLSVDPGWKHRENPPAYKTVCISDLPHCHDKPVKSLILQKKSASKKSVKYILVIY